MNLNEAYDQYRNNPTDSAMEALYPFVREKVKRTVRFRLHTEPDEDLVVSVTTDVLMRIDKFNPDKAGFGTWVEKLTRDFVVDHLRRFPKREDDAQPPAFQQYAFDKSLDGTVPEELATDSNLSFAQLYERVETVLTDEEKGLLKLKLEGREGAEIADILMIPHGTVRRKWHEIKEKVANKLAA